MLIRDGKERKRKNKVFHFLMPTSRDFSFFLNTAFHFAKHLFGKRFESFSGKVREDVRLWAFGWDMVRLLSA